MSAVLGPRASELVGEITSALDADFRLGPNQREAVRQVLREAFIRVTQEAIALHVSKGEQ